MVYNYTKPRGPIAAMYGSPGPCYGLPGLVGQPSHDPRSVHNRGPAYPFGIRHGKWRDDSSPGPAYFPHPKIYRDGKDGTQHWSLYDRCKSAPSFKTPGPGAYSPETTTKLNSKSDYKRAPAYSLGGRTKARKNDSNPAPNNYTLDSMMSKTVRAGKRQAPAYSLRSRSNVGAFYQDLAKTPGPGSYGTAGPDTYNNKRKLPSYSLTGRNAMPGDGTQKPGPGAHSPENSTGAVKRSAPSCSFGIRHSQYTAPLIINPVD